MKPTRAWSFRLALTFQSQLRRRYSSLLKSQNTTAAAPLDSPLLRFWNRNRPWALDDLPDLTDATSLIRYRPRYNSDFRPDRVVPSWLVVASAESRDPPSNQDPTWAARSMLSHVDVVWTPTADTTGSAVWLHCDTRRYLIGRVPEGAQRVLADRSANRPMIKLEEIMVTGPVGSETCSGLMGMVLTLAGSKGMAAKDAAAQKEKQGKDKQGKGAPKSRLRLRGGRNLPFYLALGRRFIMRQNLPLEVDEILTDPRLQDPANTEHDWEDENIKVWNVPLYANTSHSPGGRKRAKLSHHGPAAARAGSGDELEQPGALSESDRQLVQSVLMTMFESDWRLDALVETRLPEVKMPATVFVRRNGNLQKYDGPLPGGPVPVPDIPVLVRRPWPGALIKQLPKTSPSHTSMCYIVKLHTRRGKFDLAEADKLGVQKRDRGKLCNGNSVTLASGQVITPEMVMSPSIPGTGFAVVDIPSADYIDSLISRPEWDNKDIMSNISAMYWTLGSGLAQDERLLAFMSKHSSLRHTVSSPDVCPNNIGFGSSTKSIIRHHYLDPKRFPLPEYSNEANTPGPSSKPFTPAISEARLHLAPKVTFEDLRALSHLVTDDPELAPTLPVKRLINAAHAKIQSPAFRARVEAENKGLPCPEAEVIALGTGSALPSVYRNVSATLVRVPGCGNYLFDCGENTLGQLRRHFGLEGANEVLRDLRVLWLSHPHADHHLGTVRVLKAWEAATSPCSAGESESPPEALPRLAVVSCRDLINYIKEYQQVEHVSNRLDLIRTVASGKDPIARPIVFSEAQKAQLGGLTRIDACRTEHCYDSFAVVFTWGDTGLRVAFSGDCRPSDNFVAIGQGATLLIHEATFDNDKQGDALAKKHSTMAEAMDVATRMRARRVLMTHFSQRYASIPRDMAQGAANDMVVLFAFDHMRAKLGEFTEATEFLPALQEMYAEVLAREGNEESDVTAPDVAAAVEEMPAEAVASAA